MQKLGWKAFLIFLLVSFLIIAGFSLNFWLRHRDDVASLEHVGHPDWIRPQQLVSSAFASKYTVLSEEDNFNIIYIQRDSKSGKETLYIQKHDFNGKIQNSKEFLTAQSLNSFTAQKKEDDIFLLAVVGKRDAEQKLKLFHLDESFNILEEKVLLGDLSYTVSVESIRNDEDLYITLTTDQDRNYIIELLKYNVNSEQIITRTITDSDEEGRVLNLKYPNLTFYQDKLYLAWLRQDPQVLFTTTDSKNNEHQISLRSYNEELEPQDNIKVLDRAIIENKSSRPNLIGDDNKLHIFYHKYDVEDKRVFLQHLTYGLKEKKPLTQNRVGQNTSIGPAYEKWNDKHQLVYSQFDRVESYLYLREADKIDLNGEAYKLFSQFNLSTRPELFSSGDGLHLVWIENDGNQPSLYYSNNLSSRKPGFMEVVGLKSPNKDKGLLSLPIYFLGTPLLSVFRTIHVPFFTGLIVALLYYIVVKFRIETLKDLMDNIYISYTLVMGVLLLITPYVMAEAGYKGLFFPAAPDTQYIPYIFIAAFVGVIVLFTQAPTDDETNPLLAIGGSVIWIYWVTMANLVLFAHQYFI